MLKEHATVFRKLMIFIDLCIVAASFFLAYFLRNKLDGLLPLSFYMWILFVLLILWGSLLYFFGMYASFRLKKMSEILVVIAKASFFSLIILGSVNYLFKMQDVSRGLIFLVFALITFFITLEKIVLMQFFRRLRRKGFNFKNILIVGTGRRAQKFIKNVDQNKEFGLKIIGIIDKDEGKVGQQIEGHKIIGSFAALPDILRNNAVDHVLFILPRSMLGEIEQPILYCETVGVTVSIAIDFFNLQFAKCKEGSMFDLPLLTFETTSDKLWMLLVKRLSDIVFSVFALMLLIPVLGIVAIVIKITSKGAIFFRQERCTLRGRKFMLYKFRTMVKDAEQKLAELQKFNEMKGPVFKIKNDPRLTKIGKFLRKFSVDELPQFWNVLKGDMSLVGPRPPIAQEVENYDHWQRRRLSMRPGITCLWQIMGRNKIIDFNEWMRLDLQYIDNWSLFLDFKILLKTVPVVLFGIGAK